MMASFENQVRNIDQKNAQNERRLGLTFTKLGDVLIEIATQPDIRRTDKNQFYPLPATQEVCPLQLADMETAKRQLQAKVSRSEL